MAGNVTREQVRWLYEVVTGGKDKPFVSSEPGSEGDLCGFSFSNISPVYLVRYRTTTILKGIFHSLSTSRRQIGATPRTAGGGPLKSVLVKRSGSSISGLSPGEVSRAGIQV
ncbi:uncharacterized protein NFIA_079020 [Aspergillus fischeri NRRL 181]|uniref:Uncharacterized protein n=1 Tax=Neosartorya fischeri (strain ATCC 1020 / DSM 3700 / CBS 544.65 / FGSC A1164 / JCM 1740 / NRRL 181 / WB 181) TaxID=331117 RepID=A1DF04_NEOFI|nr:uncharacterized protein NFIA_079020 [Aspergillus fischeri NRRL 181]EAW17961.1 hypothetical protein NFIA_079020 [Aspergillus fischeri NRRL 181]